MSTFSVILALIFCSLVACQETNVSLSDVAMSDVMDPKETYTEILPVRFSWNRYTVVATAAAAVVVVAGISAIASLGLPLIVYKLCYLFGGCGYGLYVDQVEDEHHPRQKRSIEYLGPILQTLAAAYEKYGEDPLKKKPETIRSFTR